jgi:hypothetical protein
MRPLFFALLSVLQSVAFAQHNVSFIPSQLLDTIPEEIHEKLKARLVADKSRVSGPKKESDYIKTLYEQRFEYVVNAFNEGYFMVDHSLTYTLRRIAERILVSNPSLPREVDVYAYRSGEPNALSFGEGSIGIMVGLLERLQTEDDVAFVLCHEFAHYYAKHAERNFARVAALNYDKELGKKISQIKRTPYGRYSKLKALFEDLGMSMGTHTREAEFEADSLGLVYFLNTGYDRYAPIRTMEVLSTADKGFYQQPIDFKKHFDFKDFPFKEQWTSYSQPAVTYASLAASKNDSLRTHPDTGRRSRRLARQLGGEFSGDSSQATSFTKWSELASFEIINSNYQLKQYGRSLFYAMMLAERFPENPYPSAMISKSLYQLYKAQKEHNLDKVLELLDPRFDENYNRLLTFLHKLRLHELARLGYEYVISRPAEFYTNEDIIHALWLCSGFDFSKVDRNKVTEEYRTLYPQGRYLKEMTNR